MNLQDKAQKKFDELGQPVFLLAYLQHITDLQAQLIEDLAVAVGESTLPEDVKGRLTLLRQVLSVSSIDFENIQHPLESYKIPAAAQLKANANVLMRQYLAAKLRDGNL